ncbi:uncharacterized protein LOC126903095 isoform X3 [Daktulosphaira vitifoliae]|uniref:uncharacterized protein LOC126903095 isoform X3 n=1 Tax=Daktulosphaira vitifoliae TaxID=58002 RepID=UPI0021A9A0A6|nr:uncharacterized protein LOC126903095 isoform X3 [Daktulosphaira vitifoliae]
MTTQNLNYEMELYTKNKEVIEKILYVLNVIESDRLVEQANVIDKIHSFEYEKLKRTANIILKMAISDQKFGLPCAFICAALKNLQVPFYSKENDVICDFMNFKDLIVHKSLLILLSTAWDQNAQSEHSYLVAKSRFICEMYQQKMITSDLIILSLQKLIISNCNVQIESACYIMMVIGKDLSQNKKFSKLIENLKRLLINAVHNNISNNVCFLIIDLVNLERNHWKQNNPDLFIKEKVCITLNETVNIFDRGINSNFDSSFINNIEKPNNISKGTDVKLDKIKTLMAQSREQIKTVPVIQKEINLLGTSTTIANMTKNVTKSSSLKKLKTDVQMFENHLKKLNCTDAVKFEEILKKLSINKLFLLEISCIIIKQAHLNPKLILMYVNLCSFIHNECQSKKKLPCGLTFNQIIIEKCNNIFHQNFMKKKKNHKKIEDFSVDRTKQTISHCQFIAELYMKEIISQKNFTRLIKKLFYKSKSSRQLGLKDEFNKFLECICIMLLITGRKLDEKSKQCFNAFYENLRLIVSENNNIKISNDLRSKIHHIFNLRNNNWSCKEKIAPNNIPKNTKRTLKTNNECRKKFKANNSDENKLKLNKIINPWLSQKLLSSTKNKKINLALRDTYYCPVYAQLCSNLKNIKVPCGFNESTHQIIMSISFYEVLVREFLDVFDVVDYQIEDIINRKTENTMPIENNIINKYQYHLLANCSFIIELLKQSVITSDVIFYCFKKLIIKSKRFEGFLECVYYFYSEISEIMLKKYDLKEQLFQLIDLHNRKNEIQLSKKWDLLLSDMIKLLSKEYL